jgi:hypothetical protein
MSGMPDASPLVTKWTFLMFQLNSLLDRGRNLDKEETTRHIQDGSLFGWLAEEFPFSEAGLDLSPYRPGVVYPADDMIEVLQRIDSAVGSRKLGVTHNGLAMLIAYALQAIQQGE